MGPASKKHIFKKNKFAYVSRICRNSEQMGFRFLIHLNPIHKSCLTRITSPSSYANSRILKKNSCASAAVAALNSNLYEQSSTCFSENPNFKIHRRWHVGGGHSHHHHHHDHQDLRSGKEGENIFRLGLAADIGLATGKAVTGYLSGSTAIIADAAHSISDVV